MKTAILLALLISCVTGCTLVPRAERVWMEEKTNLLQTARGVEIGFYDVPTSNWIWFAVTNEVDLKGLREALPRSYMSMARPHERSAIEYGRPSIGVIYPDSGTLTTNGKAHPATVIFISANGLVSHMRGGLKDPDWHGTVIPRYRDAVVRLCLRHGIPKNKLTDFESARPD
jgi:hypothetical protein